MESDWSMEWSMESDWSKHEIIFRGGPLDGKIDRVFIGCRAVNIPKMGAGLQISRLTGQLMPVIDTLVYRATDDREAGRQVFRYGG